MPTYRWRTVGAGLLLCLLGSAAASAQPPQSGTAAAARTVDAPSAFSIEAARTAAPITIDGKLDEAAWAGARPIESLTQRDPNEGQPATEATEVRFLFVKGQLTSTDNKHEQLYERYRARP